MTCREARELADSFLSEQLLIETTTEIVRHLETCPACREEFDARRLLRTRLRSAIDAAPSLTPPPDFVASLTARLRSTAAPERVTRRAWLQSWMGAAAALATLVSGGLFARDAVRRSRLATLAAIAAGDHQNCAIKFNLREHSIPLEDAARRFDPAYAGLLSLAPPIGLSVLERHSCVFESRRFGHVVFRKNDHIVSLLVTAGGAGGSAPAIVANDSSLRVALFDAGTHAAFVVSDLSEDETLRVAEALAKPVRQALQRT